MEGIPHYSCADRDRNKVGSSLTLRKVKSMNAVASLNDTRRQQVRLSDMYGYAHGGADNQELSQSPRQWLYRQAASKFSGVRDDFEFSMQPLTCGDPGHHSNAVKQDASDILSPVVNHRTLTQQATDSLNINGDLGARSTSGYTGKIVILLLLVAVLSTTNTTSKHNASKEASPKLGAAALGSVTSFLSPILPFTGGRDLLREYGEGKTTASTFLEDLGLNFQFTGISYFFSGYSFISERIVGGGTKVLSSDRSQVLKVRGGSTGDMPVDAMERRKKLLSDTKSIPQPLLGATDPFLSTKHIAELTLLDITKVFEYAMYNNREGFDGRAFTKDASKSLELALTSMDAVTAKARGADVSPVSTLGDIGNSTSLTLSSKGYGDIDVLQFCAAMRIFAEWRLVRQVPDGYKGYAVGMALGHKDIVQNIAKVELAYYLWMEEKRWQVTNSENATATELLSPTLKDLLQQEVDLDVHEGRLPRLKDKTCAMGLLWVRRQLMYQTHIFRNVRSGEYEDAVSAVGAGYMQVYEKYHGWAVQKIFNYSFRAAPEAEEIYKFMNPVILEKVLADAKQMRIPIHPEGDVNEDFQQDGVERDAVLASAGEVYGEIEFSDVPQSLNITSEDEESSSCTSSVSSTSHDSESNGKRESENPLERLGNHIGSEWDKLATHVVSEWDKLATNVVNIFNKDNRRDENSGKRETNDMMRGGSDGSGRRLSQEDIENHVAAEMTRVAHEQIGTYLEVIEPLLQDLKGLFDEMNMEDPTKV
eukprot:CAMPEP_0196811052 /NCGR_PEP_ID=MMETSP1362-20130617/16919_1 /TAXON_ID=163516 /ORGANISM="Leptocylindrus danicus, Strain CCMP1856" /LENGTH=760 /DNA_ID=CAMNT_0042186295 /DNA_START=47 /DNA_END=2329 /DNA_ORIENTATION=+